MGAHLAILTLAPDRDYVAGQQVVASMAFTVGGVATDPSDVTLIAQRPGGSAVTYTYSGATITRDGTGAYHVNITLDAGGVWMFHVKGTGAVVAATVDDLNCQDPFPVPAPPASPGLPFAGQVAVVAASGTYVPLAGTAEGDALKYAPDGTSPTGFSWQKRRGWVIPDVDTTGGVDAAAEIQRCLHLRDGVCVSLPEGTIKIATPIVSTRNGAKLLGTAPGYSAGTQFLVSIAGAGQDIITMSGQRCEVEGISVRALNKYTNGYALKMTDALGGRISNFIVNDCYNGIWINRSTETWVRDWSLGNLAGPRGLYYAGDNTGTCFRLVLGTCTNSVDYVTGIVGNLIAWAPGQTVVQGNIRTANGQLWQVDVGGGGVTAGAGTGPSAIPGTDPGSARSTQVNDNGVKWRWICNADLTWVYQGSYTQTIATDGKLALLNAPYGIVMSDDAGSGTCGIQILDGVEIDHPGISAIHLVSGAGFQLTNGWISSVLGQSAIRIEGTMSNADWSIQNSTIYSVAKHGISVGKGGGMVTGNRIGRCGESASNSFDGVNIDANVSGFTVVANHFGDTNNTGAATNQRHGVNINSGTSDYYVAAPNWGRGLLGSVCFDSAQGAHSIALPSWDKPHVTTLETFDYGDGSDGNITISSGTTTLTRDTYYDTLTINGTGSLNPNGWRVFCRTLLDLTAAPANAIARNGSAGGNGSGTTGGTAGAALSAHTVGGSGAGTAGRNSGTGVGLGSSTPSGVSPANGGSAGNSSNSGSPSPQNGAFAPTSTPSRVVRATTELLEGATMIQGGQGSPGGPSGSGDGVATGGAGPGAGSGGGVIWIAAKQIARTTGVTAAGAISAKGGTCGTPGNGSGGNTGGSGGAGGAGGGWIYIVTDYLTGSAAANALDASGANGSNGGNGVGTGTGGIGGNSGAGGEIDLIVRGAGVTRTAGSAGTTGGAASGVTGGSGATGGACSATL